MNDTSCIIYHVSIFQITCIIHNIIWIILQITGLFSNYEQELGMSDTSIPNDWCKLIDGLGSSHLRMGIVSFLCDHPHMRFTSGAIPCIGNCTITEITECLDEMVDQGIVDACHQNRTILYALTGKGPWRGLIMALSEFDPYQRRSFLNNHRWQSVQIHNNDQGGQVICA